MVERQPFPLSLAIYSNSVEPSLGLTPLNDPALPAGEDLGDFEFILRIRGLGKAAGSATERPSGSRPYDRKTIRLSTIALTASTLSFTVDVDTMLFRSPAHANLRAQVIAKMSLGLGLSTISKVTSAHWFF
jgi:hypothetical protein